MTTLTLRPANAVVSMALWRTALAVVYAVIAIEVFIVAQTMISHKTLPMPTFLEARQYLAILSCVWQKRGRSKTHEG